MIALLTGKLVEREGARGILDVRGVGYEVFAPSASLERWNVAQEDVVAHIYTQVSEDSLTLYGFESRDARAAFATLLSVSGVGPKMALASLDTLTVEALTAAVEAADITALSRIKGVGKKTAQRMAIDLKGKLPAHLSVPQTASPALPKLNDALPLALERLGYSRGEIQRAVQHLADQDQGPDKAISTRLRAALSLLSGGAP